MSVWGIDRDLELQARRRRQEEQRAALDEQRAGAQPEAPRFRDGRMSDEEYAVFEERARARRKERVLERAQAQGLSAFERLEAAELAAGDEAFARALAEADSKAGTKKAQKEREESDPPPQPESKFQRLLEERRRREQRAQQVQQN